MVIPRYLVPRDSGEKAYSDSECTVEVGQVVSPVPFGPTQTIKIPSFFDECPSMWDGNDVCHIKAGAPVIRNSYNNQAYLVYGYGYGKFSYGNGTVYYSDMISNQSVTVDLNVTPDSSFTLRVRHYWSDGLQKRQYRPKPFARMHWNFTFWKSTYSRGMWSRQCLHSGGDYLDARAALVISALQQYPISRDRAVHMKMLHTAVEILGNVYDYPSQAVTYVWGDDEDYMSKYNSVYVENPTQPSPDMLILDEYNLTRSGLSGKPYAAYHLKAAMQEAYLDALDKVPQLNDNMLSNALEIVSFVKTLVIDHRVEIPKSLSSAWLSYRYQYTTTKLDVEEAINFVHRNVDSDFLRKGFSCYGAATVNHDGADITVKCHLSMKQKELSYLDKIWTGLYRYGLSPSFYIIWDMIPYSFIVDWFIPVGDILNEYDKTRMYDRTYDISDIWFSTKYELTNSHGSYSAYTRWASSSPPEFNGYYTLEYKGPPSDRQVGYRILDTLSLLIR